MSAFHKPAKFVRDPKTGRMVKHNPGTPVVIQSSARIGSTWPRNHGVRFMSR